MTSALLIIQRGLAAGFIVLAFFLVLLRSPSTDEQRLAGPRYGALGRDRDHLPPRRHRLPEAVHLRPALGGDDGVRHLRAAAGRADAESESGSPAGGDRQLLLARTMAIALVPGILVAGLIGLACLPREAWRRSLVNLGLLCLAAIAPAPWYIPNFDLVARYLTESARRTSAGYGAWRSIISWGRSTDVLARIAADDLYLVLAIFVIAGLLPFW